ncbi:peptide ABC transporter substrate-binding protein [Bacillus xiapuensis]|uniref:peptide ABC transporter substrate-binding protein n=1 Tax=Bacillus xiapuensis TaxID=2014075 RepID=UPI000C250F9F|nr:peptide ABC transporter substrate-binding protein [Bacillus xiapuensis]
MNKKFSVFLVFLLALSTFLAACGGGSGGKAGTGAKEENKEEFRVNIKTEPFSLHPGLANENTAGTVLRNTFEGLTRINKDDKPENAAAEKVDVSEDGKIYTFTIRDHKWSNGDPVTAKDFEYAWKWALDPKNQSQYAYQLYYLKNGQAANEGKAKLDDVGVKAKDDKTLVVTLENPTPYFLELTAFYTYLPVNSKIAQKDKKWYKNAGENYTSNGPFKMTEWEHSNKIVLEKNDQYWDKENVKLNKIEMAMVNDVNTELSMFKKGELDWAGAPFSSLPTDAMDSLKKEKILKNKPIAGVYWYKFNTEVEPLNNVNIRKALTYALDRKSIVEKITKGGQIPAMAAVPPSMFEENEKGYFKDHDVKKAKEYLEKGLKELGLKDASELPEISISYNTDESHQKIAQAVQDTWKKELGVKAKLGNEEWAVYIEKLHSGDYMVGRMGWLGDFNDAINFLELFREKEGGNNDTNWEHPEFKKLLVDSQKQTDPAKREQMLRDAEKIFIDEMPVAPIYFYTNSWVQKDNLKDVVISGLGDVQLKWAHFE